MFKGEDNREFCLFRKLTIGETDFSQFMGLRNQLVIGTENLGREKILSLVLIPTRSKDTVEQLKLADKEVEAVEEGNRKMCVNLPRYNVENPKNSSAQVRLFARKKEEEKFQQVVYVNYTFEEFIYILDVRNSVREKCVSKKPVRNIFQKLTAPLYSLSFLFLIESGRFGTLEILETSLLS